MARLPTADLHGTSFELVSVVADLSASALRHQVGTKYMYLGRTKVGTGYIASFAAQKAVGASGVNKQNVSAPCPLFALG